MGVGEIIMGGCKITAILNFFLKLCFLVCLFVCLFDLTVYITPNILYLVLGDLEQPPL